LGGSTAARVPNNSRLFAKPKVAKLLDANERNDMYWVRGFDRALA
jgi:hypothetical protein